MGFLVTESNENNRTLSCIGHSPVCYLYTKHFGKFSLGIVGEIPGVFGVYRGKISPGPELVYRPRSENTLINREQ